MNDYNLLFTFEIVVSIESLALPCEILSYAGPLKDSESLRSLENRELSSYRLCRLQIHRVLVLLRINRNRNIDLLIFNAEESGGQLDQARVDVSSPIRVELL